MHYHRTLTVIFLICIVAHVVEVGGIQVDKVLFASTDITGRQEISSGNSDVGDTTSTMNLDNKQLTSGEFKDGIYTGQAQGYGPGLKVSVEIKNNTIINVKVTDHNEVNSRFYSTPIKQIPLEIIDSQSVDVDTISGATFTSIGIINAVNDALSKALISGTLPDLKELPQNRGHGKR